MTEKAFYRARDDSMRERSREVASAVLHPDWYGRGVEVADAILDMLEAASPSDDDQWEPCTECGGSDPSRWFCAACGGQGGWEPYE